MGCSTDLINFFFQYGISVNWFFSYFSVCAQMLLIRTDSFNIISLWWIERWYSCSGISSLYVDCLVCYWSSGWYRSMQTIKSEWHFRFERRRGSSFWRAKDLNIFWYCFSQLNNIIEWPFHQFWHKPDRFFCLFRKCCSLQKKRRHIFDWDG